jgi:hypothetical protein
MRWPALSDVSVLWRREFRIDLRPLGRLARERPEAVIVGLGVALRVITYLDNRAMWLDEASLRANVVGVPVFEFSRPLQHDQLAPLGFLIVERVLATLVSGRNYILRFLPLAAGIGALVLFRHLASRLLAPRAALVALLLFALSDDLIYYAGEFKPYSLDLFFGVAVTLATVSALGRIPSRRLILWLAVLAVTAPWFSFASIFVIAACGSFLVIDALLASRLRLAALWLGIGLSWLANVLVTYRIARGMLASATTMYRFWAFAFSPQPDDPSWLSWAAGHLLEVFVNPLNLLCPWSSRLGVILPLPLLLIGGASLARRAGLPFVLLVSPILLAILATVLGYFPFHGRLILELVPALFLFIAEGTEWIAVRFQSPSGIAYRTVLIALLTYPCWQAVWNCPEREPREFNIHGDLHRNVFIDRPTRPTTIPATWTPR